VPALVVFAILAAGVFGVRGAVDRAARARLEGETSLLAEQVVFRLQQCVDTRLALVDSLRREVQSNPEIDLTAFGARASILVEQFPGYQAINWIDAAGRIALVTPLEPNRGALGKRVDQHPTAGTYFQVAQASGKPTLTTPLDLFQGGRGFASYYPVNGPEGPRGYVNGVFRVDTLVESCFPGGTLTTHSLHVTDGEGELYTSPSWAEARTASSPSVVPLPVSQRTWTVAVAPNQSIVAGRVEEGGVALLVIGLALSLATGIMVFLVAQRERRLNTSRARMRTLLSLLPDLVVRFARSGELLDAQGQRGPFSPTAGPGDPLQDLLPKPLADAALRAADAGTQDRSTVAVDDKHGTTTTWEVRVVRTAGDAALAVLRDVSDREEAQLQQTLLNSLIEASDLLIALHDTSGDLTYLNPFGRRLLGLPDDEPITEIQVTDMLHPDDQLFAQEALATVQAQGAWRGEGKLIPRGADPAETPPIPVDMQLFAVMHPDSRVPIAIATVARDLRETRRLEAELVRSQRLEAIGSLAGGVAHDFNNVMTAILGHSEVARTTDGLSAKALYELDGVQRSAERAARLTRQLLAFSSRQLTQTRALPLNDLVSDMQGMLRRIIPSQAEMHMDLSPDLGWVLGDEALLEQVVLNLVTNAADAMPDGGTIRVHTHNDGPDFVQLLVDDDGHGVPPELRDQIFEPFVTSKSAGTGLGLATVRRIATRLGGSVRMEALDPGTRFIVRLPRAPVGERAPELAPEGRTKTSAPPHSHPGALRRRRPLHPRGHDGLA
jgi:signal transduction histidine kinase